MNERVCYGFEGMLSEHGGDFDAVHSRLRSEVMIKKFVIKFLDDASFSTLWKAMDEGNMEEAFRAAHTLKGVCQNLSFTLLSRSAEQMTEALRAGNAAAAREILETVSADYQKTVHAIAQYRDSM